MDNAFALPARSGDEEIALIYRTATAESACAAFQAKLD